jgi:hypothetical protein
MDSSRSLAFSKKPLLFGNKLFLHRSDSAIRSRFREYLKYTNMQTLQLSSNSSQVFIQMLFCGTKVFCPISWTALLATTTEAMNSACVRSKVLAANRSKFMYQSRVADSPSYEIRMGMRLSTRLEYCARREARLGILDNVSVSVLQIKNWKYSIAWSTNARQSSCDTRV